MDFILLAVALLFLMLGGLGLSLLLTPKQPKQLGAAELPALAFLLGSAVVSSASFIFGFWISGAILRWAVAALCLSLGVAGWRRSGRTIKARAFLPAKKAVWLLLAFNAAQVCLIAWLNSIRTLGWDGLLNFEVKARAAFLNGGALPLEFFSDPSRTWTHQSYPLLLPLTESWLYSWLGRADQSLVKILFPLFFAAALCLLQAGGRRLAFGDWQIFVAPALLFTAPLLFIGDGSASSGYADFPLAVFYLAAVIWWLEFQRHSDFAALRLAGVLLAAACWLKQEGLILWLCLMALTAAKAFIEVAQWRMWRQILLAALPGLLVIATWRGFVRFVNPPGGNEFLPLGVATLRANLWRLPGIAEAALKELANWRHWSVFWAVAAAAILWLCFSAQRQWQHEVTGIAPTVLIPTAIYSAIYIFSIWPDFIGHLQASFPRLLIHVSLVAALLACNCSRNLRS
ncbi:MAG TPA: hypothetical protein PLD20_06240 [Blastocatellia bacterium]|nr:hypothetical protein [Blastocatellia bacterium]HMZ17507.1 hypothetical protein [Blastocatellia bacterium]HNG33389.1 hypothetical protein [Blastocatellia bacterium]